MAGGCTVGRAVEVVVVGVVDEIEFNTSVRKIELSFDEL